MTFIRPNCYFSTDSEYSVIGPNREQTPSIKFRYVPLILMCVWCAMYNVLLWQCPLVAVMAAHDVLAPNIITREPTNEIFQQSYGTRTVF